MPNASAGAKFKIYRRKIRVLSKTTFSFNEQNYLHKICIINLVQYIVDDGKAGTYG